MRAITATVLALAALGLAACGGEDNPNSRSLGDRARDVDPQPTKEAEQLPVAEAEKKADPDPRPTGARGPQRFRGGDANDRKIQISSADFPSGTWPLTIESGELRCVDTETTRTIIFSADGKDYPVNGVPDGGRIIGIEPIWKKKDDPQSPGTRMDITPLFKKGYELCGD